MDLKEYFENNQGFGVLATSDSSGTVDAAIYARPHVIDEKTVAFIMAEKLSHQNLRSNPHAAYLFKENGNGYSGTRLFLTKIKEENDKEKIKSMIRRKKYDLEKEAGDSSMYLVYFHVDRVEPLLGSGKCPITY